MANKPVKLLSTENLDKEINKILDSIKTEGVAKNTKSMVDILEKLNGKAVDARMPTSGRPINSKNAKVNKNITKQITDLALEENSYITTDLENRTKLYNTYKTVLRTFPQLSNAINKVAGAIIMPQISGKFKRGIPIVEIEGLPSGLEESKKEELSRITAITSELKIDTLLNTLVYNTIAYGDEFLEIIDFANNDVEEEITKLTESENSNKEKSMSDKVVEELLLESHRIGLSKEVDLKSLKEYATDISGLISVNKYPEDLVLLKELESESNKPSGKASSVSDSVILNRLDRSRVTKLELYGRIIGYIYVDINNLNKTKKKNGGVNETSADYANISNATSKSFEKLKDKQKGINEEGRNIISDFIIDKFIKSITLPNTNAKINKKLLDRISKEKDIIRLVKLALTDKSSINLRFIPAEKMVHFKNNEINDDDKYGESLMFKLLFLIKHYLLIMKTLTLYMITRAVERRKITVEVSSDMNAEEAINEVIKTLKKREVSLVDSLNNIQEVETELSPFNDVFLPSVNSETPINFDVIPGTSMNLDTEYLDNLRRSIITGIEVPRALLNEQENSYHTSLAQESNMFAQLILNKQPLFEEYFRELYQKIYKLVYSKDIKYHTLKFNPPTAIMNENLANDISTMDTIVNFIIDKYTDSETQKVSINKVLVAKFVAPQLDWETIEDIAEQSKIIEEENKIKTGNKKDSETGGF